MQQTNTNFIFILLLGMISSITPFAVDTYIPSMPSIASEFGVDISYVEFSLSVFLFGMCFGLIGGGILSDRFGRKKSVILGLSGFIIMSVNLFFCDNLHYLLILRFFQALFGGMIVVNSPAIVRDLYSGADLTRMFAMVSTISMLAPILAPIIGTFIISFFHWTYIFLFLAIYGCVVLVFIYYKLPETYTYHKSTIISSYLSVLTHRQAMYYILTLSISFGAMFIFITKSAFIYINHFGVDTKYFPIFFGVDVVFLILATRYNLILITKYKTQNIIKFGIIVQLLSSICILAFYDSISLMVAFVLISINVSMVGLIFGNANSLALQDFSKNSGIASSVIGILNFGIASLLSFCVSILHDGTLLPIAFGMLIASILALVCITKAN